MVLKIATGSKKGITLASTKSARELRPTQALVREAIINIVRGLQETEGMAVLDLYAGIGTVGLELLSNGAEVVTFVEKDPRCLKILRDNLSTLGYSGQATIVTKALPQALSRLKTKGFDLIFADPPYAALSMALIIKEILDKELLKVGGILIWECARREAAKPALEADFAGLELLKIKTYGESSLIFLQKPDPMTFTFR